MFARFLTQLVGTTPVYWVFDSLDFFFKAEDGIGNIGVTGVQTCALPISPELGSPVVKELLQHRRVFTAIVSFNDIAAIGAIRALRDANLRVPEDVSVIGFDDIQVAAYHNPRLTTIRQPLHDMGETAARILLQRMQGFKDYPVEFAVPPELIIR